MTCGKRPREVIAAEQCRLCHGRARRAKLYATPCSYEAAHRRVQTARGGASDWRCAKCGEVAEQWAYLGESPREIRGPRTYRRDGRDVTVTLAWSPDPADYTALCRLCHGLATRPDYGRGYRHDPQARAAYLERHRQRERERYAALRADPDRYAEYLSRKQRTARRSR